MDYRGPDDSKPGFFGSRSNIALLGFLLIAGFYLISEHYVHVIPYLPWLLVLACPLLHLFMHGGHNRDDERDNGPSARKPHQH